MARTALSAHQDTERATQSQALVHGSGMIAERVHFETPPAARPTIVLVRGGFVDGSGWQCVRRILRNEGYTVRIVPNSTTSLADDVAATRRVVDMQERPVILVGHSYGGAVITEAGRHPKVAGLVYISAFVPDEGESVSWLMAEAQLPCGTGALNDKISEPAWRKKPSWFLVAADDRIIPARAQWAMAKRARSTVTETGGSHALHVSRPAAVAAIIAKGASALALAVKWAA